MPHYDHSQPGYTILGILLLAVFTILFTIAICSHYSWVPFALLAVLILTALLFGSLRVEIRDHRIRWRLGVGVLRGEISLAQVARVEKRKSGFCTGWGIRRISGGWLYNVSGLDYVALILKDGRVVGLGTDEPDALAGTLLRHLKAHPSAAGGGPVKHLIDWLRRSLNITGSGITGAWLLIFYGLSIWMVLGTMSAQQFQEKLHQISNQDGARKDGGAISVADIRQLLEYKEKLDAIDAALVDGERQVQTLKVTSAVRMVEYDRAETAKDERFRPLKMLLDGKGWEYLPPTPEDIKARLDPNSAQDPEVSGAVNQYQEAWHQFQSQEKNLTDINEQLQRVKAANLALRSDRERLQTEQDELFSRNAGMREHVNELIYLRKLRVDFLATMPEQMLTLLLTLSMGALGSVIFLTRSFFDPKIERPFSWYLFRPFLGMATAIAIFILAKAGQIVISDTSTAEGLSSNLNPFFIAFLAIVSGLLSEQAYERIQKSGFAFFGVDERSGGRWAFGLKRELERRGRSAADIATLLRVPTRVAENWVEERQPVMEREQELLSVWLDRPVREIFSDLAPARVEDAGARRADRDGIADHDAESLPKGDAG